MSPYLQQRLLLLLPTLLGASIIVFALVRLVPGGPAGAACGMDCTPQQYDAIEKAMGLQRPLPEQYVDWLGGVLTWDLGNSLFSGSPIEDQLKTALPVTLELGLLGLLIAVLIALPTGVAAAVYQDSVLDYVVRGTSIGMLSIPTFWLAIFLIAIGARYQFWTPPLSYVPLTQDPLANLRIMWVPALLLGISVAGTLTRLIRSEMLEVLRQDYVRTASAKGLHRRAVIIGHALRNALLPFVTMLGSQVTVLIGGSVILESIFNLPGMGRYLLTSVLHNDIPVIQTINLLAALFVISVNLAVDMTYSLIDPRVRQH